MSPGEEIEQLKADLAAARAERDAFATSEAGTRMAHGNVCRQLDAAITERDDARQVLDMAIGPHCSGCGSAIDPDCCWCGDALGSHNGDDGHPFVAMGCDCLRAERDWRRVATAHRERAWTLTRNLDAARAELATVKAMVSAAWMAAGEPEASTELQASLSACLATLIRQRDESRAKRRLYYAERQVQEREDVLRVTVARLEAERDDLRSAIDVAGVIERVTETCERNTAEKIAAFVDEWDNGREDVAGRIRKGEWRTP